MLHVLSKNHAPLVTCICLSYVHHDVLYGILQNIVCLDYNRRSEKGVPRARSRQYAFRSEFVSTYTRIRIVNLRVPSSPSDAFPLRPHG